MKRSAGKDEHGTCPMMTAGMSGDGGDAVADEMTEATRELGENEAVTTEAGDGTLGDLAWDAGFEDGGYDFEEKLVGKVG